MVKPRLIPGLRSSNPSHAGVETSALGTTACLCFFHVTYPQSWADNASLITTPLTVSSAWGFFFIQKAHQAEKDQQKEWAWHKARGTAPGSG